MKSVPHKKHFIHSKDIPANINLYNFLKTVLCFAVFQFFYILLFSPTFQSLQPALDALLMQRCSSICGKKNETIVQKVLYKAVYCVKHLTTLS